MFIAVAIHHAAPEYAGEFTDFMYKVLDTAFQAALPTIQSLAPLRKPEWSTRPDDVITLVEAERRTT